MIEKTSLTPFRRLNFIFRYISNRFRAPAPVGPPRGPRPGRAGLKSLAKVSLGFLLASSAAPGGADFVRDFDPDRGISLELVDYLDFPAYAWPRTLLTYPIRFHGDVAPGDLRLVNQKNGEAVPFQLSGIRSDGDQLAFAKLSFFADLPSGEARTYRLSASGSTAAIPPVREPVKSRQLGNELLEIDGGALGVRIPLSRNFGAQDAVPGPVMGLKTGDGWIGRSRLVGGNKTVESLTTETLESGDLFARYRLTYRFVQGGSYQVVLTVISGYEFVKYEETMVELDPMDDVAVEMVWNQFDPTQRFGSDWRDVHQPGEAWPGIERPIRTSYYKEDPSWQPGWREDPEEAMIFRLSPYGGNSVRENPPHISFWEGSPEGRELGVFVLDHERWQDHQYEVWQHSTLLQVRFRYGSETLADGDDEKKLIWTWPLITGTRSTGISMHRVADGEAEVERYRTYYQPVEQAGITSNTRFLVDSMKLRYVQLLRSMHGFLSLNKVKDWDLEYAEAAPRADAVFDSGYAETADQFEDMLFRSSFVFYPLGLNTWPGINSIQHRFVYDWVTDGYNRLHSEFRPEQRKRIEALLLLTGYITSSEAMHPILTALAGAPNMAADGWSVPGQIAFLFPKHPMAGEWLDYYEQTMRTSSRFFTRPDVPALESHGGRWAESLSVYNWAHLRPTSHSFVAGLLRDGRNRWANPWTADRGRWMVDMLTAPIFNPKPSWRMKSPRGEAPKALDPQWQPGDPLGTEFGFTRQYPAHGAHGSGTTIMPPSFVGLMGHAMRRYRPLLGEHLMWVNQGEGTFGKHNMWLRFIDKDFDYRTVAHTDWQGLEREIFDWENKGTPPDLVSTKYTGHGIVVRAGVGTPEELSIHLNQVDRGPNYRWGNTGEGASGILYFYARGKLFTAHETESSGDRDLDDTDGVTTFGVMKEGTYRSIGMNLLEQPLYDLGVAQFAAITPRQGPGAYSWPEYAGRNLFLVGTDYFILSDEMGTTGRNSSRFTWFTANDQEFPNLVFLQPSSTRDDHWTLLRTRLSKGFHRDAKGTHHVLVTHKDDVEVENMRSRELPFLNQPKLKEYRRIDKGNLPAGAYLVQTPTSRDLLFRHEDGLTHSAEGVDFEGQAGVIRRRDNNLLELAMVHSKRIGADGVMIEVDRPELGVSLKSDPDHSGYVGQFYSRLGGSMSLRLDAAEKMGDFSFYVDGAPYPAEMDAATGVFSAQLPPGAGQWELSARSPRPMRPTVLRTGNRSGGARVFWTKSEGATGYRIEISEDNTETWQEREKVSADEGSLELDQLLEGLNNGSKLHVRVIAVNDAHHSVPSAAYPIYVSDEAPLPPDGLFLNLGEDQVDLSWGSVLGVDSYQLYRRAVGDLAWTLLSEGLSTEFLDRSAVGTVPAFPLPGAEANALAEMDDVIVYEYAVSSANGNGEGPKSLPVSTDPRSWLNWSPDTDSMHFRRDTAYWKPPYVPAEFEPPSAYPSAEQPEVGEGLD